MERRLTRLREAVEVGGDVRTLVTAMRELEAKRDALAQDLASAQPAPRLPKPVLDDRLAEWRRQLRSSVPQARAVLQRIIDGRITFTPHSNGYEFTARTRFDRLFEGLFVPLAAMPDYIRPLVGDRRGLEYIDSEFSRVLERAQNKGQRMASPPGTDGVQTEIDRWIAA